MTDDTDNADVWDHKVRENRARRRANRQGLVIEKTRRRDPQALDYGTYTVSSASDPAQTMTLPGLAAVETFLNTPVQKRKDIWECASQQRKKDP